MNVWTYWEGPRPPYIDVCLASMARVCDTPGVTFYLVTPENLPVFVHSSDLHPSYLALPEIALRADCIRAALLARHGGFWWDADTIGLRSPLPLVSAYAEADAIYTTWTKPPLRVLNGYIYLRRGCKAARDWLNQINHALCHSLHGTSWCSLGEHLLSAMLPEQPRCRRIDRRLVLPIDIDANVRDFFRPGDFRAALIDDTVCYGLNHSWFMHHKRSAMTMPPAAWPDSRLLIHQLLCFAQQAETELTQT